MSCYILINPLAGTGCCENDLSALKNKLDEQIISKKVTEIEDYREFFAKISCDDKIVLCGGDGTLNRFINNTHGIDIACDVLYYPTGTGNDFLTDLGKKKGMDEPFSIKEYIKDLPSVEVQGKTYRFLNNVGFGIDGYCCEIGDKLKESSSKKINYTSIAINGLLFHYKPTNATVTVDGKEYKYKKVWLAPTMKGRYYGGGMMAAPEQDRTDKDGTLSLMLFYGKGRLRTLIAFPSIFKGEHVKRKKMVAIHTGKVISVVFDSPAALQIDGETILGVTSYTARSNSLVTSDK